MFAPVPTRDRTHDTGLLITPALTVVVGEWIAGWHGSDHVRPVDARSVPPEAELVHGFTF